MTRTRIIALAAAALAALLGGAVLAAPSAVQWFAERQVDQALRNMRLQSTVTASRGPVSVNLSDRAVSVRDLAIDTPGEASKTRVGELTIVNPSESEGLLTADRVSFSAVAIDSGSETITIPRIDLTGYSGPARGLVATPGIGARAHSQAEIIARVSLGAASIPSISIRNARSRIERTVSDVSLNGVVAGVVGSGRVGGLSIASPPRKRGREPRFALTTGEILYEQVSLPTLWRFYASDGGGDREPLLKSASVADLAVRVASREGPVVAAAIDRLGLEGVETRPLAFSVSELDDLAAELWGEEPATPAAIRREVRLLVELVGAVSFEDATLSNARIGGTSSDPPPATLKVGGIEAGPYADARLERLRLEKVAVDDGQGSTAAAETLEASKFDASQFVAYFARVARDEVLMSFRPTAEEVIRTAPRLGGVDVSGVRIGTPAGTASLNAARIDLNAPLDAVPQRLQASFESLDAAPVAGSQAAQTLETARLERVRGSGRLSLTLDPTANELRLDALDFDVADLGALTARGALAEVDPTLALSTGATFVDKLFAVTPEQFRFTFRDDGAVETLLTRAAAAAGQPPGPFREAVAREAEERVVRLFGPPAANSGAALADFIRTPRTLEVTVAPRDPEVKMIDVVRSIPLGPEGIARTVEVRVLARR